MDAIPEMLDGRYELATEIRLEVPLHVSVETAGLIRAGVSKNTLKAYRHASKKLASWLAERVLDDGLLSKNITNPHQLGNSLATISQAVAAVKWTAKNAGRADVVGVITERTLAGIRRAGKGGAVAVKLTGWSGMTLRASVPTLRRLRRWQG